MREKLKVEVEDETYRELKRRSRSLSMSSRSVRRAKIILCRADGLAKSETARRLGVSEVTVQTWTDRFRAEGLDGLEDRKGRGRRSTIGNAVREKTITQATQPPNGLSRHSTRTMARTVGVSQHTVRPIWRENGIKPHLMHAFKVSRAPDS